MQPALSKALNASVVVDNQPGAGGVVGLQALARSAPDGNTLSMVSNNVVIFPSVIKSLSFDMPGDFTPIAIVGATPMVLVVNPNKVAARNAAEFIALLKSKPDGLNFASGGTGTILHLATQLFLEEAKVTAKHIPYKGVGPMISDLIGGQVEFATAALPLASVPMKFPCTMLLFASDSSARPTVPFPERTLRAAAVVPPIWFPFAPSYNVNPAKPFVMALVPVGSVPQKLPWTTLPETFAPVSRKPSDVLPEKTLPLMTLLDAPSITYMPTIVLGNAAVPLAFRPKKFPRTVLCFVSTPPSQRPKSLLPEKTLRAAAIAPPMTFEREPPPTNEPPILLLTASEPATSVPM